MCRVWQRNYRWADGLTDPWIRMIFPWRNPPGIGVNNGIGCKVDHPIKHILKLNSCKNDRGGRLEWEGIEVTGFTTGAAITMFVWWINSGRYEPSNCSIIVWDMIRMTKCYEWRVTVLWMITQYSTELINILRQKFAVKNRKRRRCRRVSFLFYFLNFFLNFFLICSKKFY